MAESGQADWLTSAAADAWSGTEANLSTIWHLYLIECADGSLYTGITTDVDRRFQEHLSGKGGRYTRSHAPVRVAASVAVGSRSLALRAELAIKRLPREKKVEAVRSLEHLSIRTGDRTWATTFKAAVPGNNGAKNR